MEVILIHKPRGINPPEAMARNIEMLKKFMAKPEQFVSGGKVISSYSARAKSLVFCVWDVPNIEAFCPFLEQMVMVGWDTDIIPVDKSTVAVEKWEKALKAMKG